jgi:hypothetical protein
MDGEARWCGFSACFSRLEGPSPVNDNPWQHLPEKPPFVLPDEEPAIRSFNAKATPNRFLHVTEVLPEPFVGTPLAPVVVLGNNPGFSEKGLSLRQNPAFMARMRANLLHTPSDYPFVHLAPDFTRPSKGWWERKLNHLLRHFGNEVVSRSILAVEYFPYSSRKYGHRELRDLPSLKYSFRLVAQAINRGAVVIITRGEKRWVSAVPELKSYDRGFRLKNRQKSSISPGNCPGYQEVIQAIEVAEGGAAN